MLHEVPSFFTVHVPTKMSEHTTDERGCVCVRVCVWGGFGGDASSHSRIFKGRTETRPQSLSPRHRQCVCERPGGFIDTLLSLLGWK